MIVAFVTNQISVEEQIVWPVLNGLNRLNGFESEKYVELMEDMRLIVVIIIQLLL